MPAKPTALLALNTRARWCMGSSMASQACSMGANAPAEPLAPRPKAPTTAAATSSQGVLVSSATNAASACSRS